MALISSRWLRLSRFLVPVVLFLIFTNYFWNHPELAFFKPWTIKGGSHNETNTEKSNQSNSNEKTAERKKIFIQQASAWEIDGVFDDTPLRDLCNTKTWQPGLIVKCDDSFGGVGNIRNMMLTCIRYAIEAGATSLIVPQIEARDADLVNLHQGTKLPFTYMFDEEFFTKSLSAACPQMTIFANETLLDPAINRATITPKKLGNKFEEGRVVDFAGDWREGFDKWMVDFGAPSGFNESKPILVTTRPSWFEWPILYDPVSFIATFGRILRFNSKFLDLAAIVLYALNKEYMLGIEPAEVGIPAEGTFYGAHLRTDQDAVAASFASYDEQSSAYLASAQRHGLSTIYLASGSPPDIIRFTSAADEMGILVASKLSLLEQYPEFADALKELQALTWDQQALIDYMVLLRSSHFGGTWASSFGYNIVFKRHVVVGGGKWLPSKSALEATELRLEWEDSSGLGSDDELEEGECYKDRISTVFGAPKMGLWFELSMWP